MYKDDLQYKTNMELEALLEERQKEIEWIKAEQDSRKESSDELIKYKEQIEKIIAEGTFPYIVLKFERRNTGPIVLVSRRGYTGVEVTKNHINNPSIFITSCRCSVIYYASDNKSCNVDFYKDNEYSSNYIDNVDSFLKGFKDCFLNEEEAKKIIAVAINQNCLNHYNDNKKDMEKVFGMHLKSTLHIKDEFAEYTL